MLGAMDLGIADDGERAGREQAAQIAIASFANTPSLSLPPLEFCLGTSPIQAEKSLPDRNTFGSATLATRAVASAGPMPGIASSRLLTSFERCQAVMRRSNSRICAFSARSWVPSTATHARATSGNLGVSGIVLMPLITSISYNAEQLFDTIAPDRRDDPELGKMRADDVDH